MLERLSPAMLSILDVWTHGDFVMIHPITKQLIFLGRTDGVLNPSGVRFGSADIYRVIESRFSSEIKDSLCVGQKRDGDSDERVMLFLLMKPGIPFTLSIVERVKASIRAELSPRHVPTFIFQTPEIPVCVCVCVIFTKISKLFFVAGNNKLEENRAPGQKNCLRPPGRALRYAA